jgi:hypothetical protein
MEDIKMSDTFDHESDAMDDLMDYEYNNKVEIIDGKPESTINMLREKYGGKWRYCSIGVWEHIGKGYAKRCAILGGYNGDDYCGSRLYYYPKNGKPEIII